MVELVPVLDLVGWPAERALELLGDLGGAVDVLDLELDAHHLIAATDELLRVAQRRVHQPAVVFVEAAIEDTGDAELARARCARLRAPGIEVDVRERHDDRDVIADLRLELVGELLAHDDRR